MLFGEIFPFEDILAPFGDMFGTILEVEITTIQNIMVLNKILLKFDNCALVTIE